MAGKMERRIATPWRGVALVVALTGIPACAGAAGELADGRRAYEQGEDERALAVFRVLGDRLDELSPADRARYAFLRGMADYRLGYRADARHWLALAAAAPPGALDPDAASSLRGRLAELDAVVYAEGVPALSVAAPPRPAEQTVVQAADESSGLFDGGASDAR